MKQPNDPKLGLLDSDENGPADDESSMSPGKCDDAGTEPREDPDDPLTDPDIKCGFEKLKELVDKEGDVELEMGRELNRVDEALKDKQTRHGQWGKILKNDLGIGYKKASRARAHANFHGWAETTRNLDHLSKIPRSARYLLGAPETTDEQREEAVRHVKKEGSLDLKTAKRIVGLEGKLKDPFKVLVESFDRWADKFNDAEAGVQDRIINDIRKRHLELVTSMYPSAEQAKEPPTGPEGT